MASPIPIDPYAVLGVAKDATLPTIRTAHRKLVLKCHPDKIKDENQRSQGQDEFQKVQQAYELLSDDSKRARYDQKVKLAELRKEAMERDGGSSSSPYAGMKTGGSGSFEYRGGRVYEERVPASTRFFDEEVRFTEEPRPSSRKNTDYAKRSVNRDVDDRKRSKHTDPKVDPIRSTKERAREVRESVKAGHEDRQKHRDRERRREFSEKYSRTAAFVESDDGSDSDGSYYRRRSSRKVYDDPPRRSKVESSRRHESRRSRDDDFTDDRESKHESLHINAREYIQRSKGSAPVDVDRRPRSSRSPTHYYDVRDSPQPDSARRSSARPRARDSGRPDSSGRDRRGSIDIVEPLSRSHETRKPPTLAAATSAPMAIKIPPSSTKLAPPQLQRSSTGHVRERRDPPPVRRSETTPLFGVGSRRGEHVPSRSSKLKGAEISDSGYSSPGTPEMYQGNSPSKPTTKYTIVDEDEEYARVHPTVLVSPDPSYRRQKSTSPIRSERPPPTVRPSPKPTRTATYAYPSDALPTRQNLTRHESARAVPSSRNSPPLRGSSARERLFGEMSPEEQAQKFSDEHVRYSPKIRPEDVNYGSYNVRKASVDTATTHRDAYPRSQYDHHRQPGLGRSESYAY